TDPVLQLQLLGRDVELKLGDLECVARRGRLLLLHDDGHGYLGLWVNARPESAGVNGPEPAHSTPRKGPRNGNWGRVYCRAMSPSRAARGVLAAGAAVYALAVLCLSVHPGPRAWAFHLPGFLPAPTRILVLTLLVGGAGLLAWDFTRAPQGQSRGKGAKPRARAKVNPLPTWSGWLLLP